MSTSSKNNGDFADKIALMDVAMKEELNKREVLRNLDCFVLDNTIRESAVGAFRGHTIDNKWKLYQEAKKCGMKHIIVAAFSHMKRVDDDFIQQLRENGEDFATLYAFTEVSVSIKDGAPDTVTVPFSLKKMKKYGLRNPIIEVDLADKSIDWEGRYTVEDYCHLMHKWITWTKENLSQAANVFVSVRDLAVAMKESPDRVLRIVKYLATLPKDIRPFGLNFEEPSGKFMPEELGIYTSVVRGVMNENGWQNGHLLVHIHEKWGVAATAQLACLSNGANGVWASISAEGAAVGHACSTVTIMNLIRLGNTKVLQRYNCVNLRKAAVRITEVSTGIKPHPKQIIYGERALDVTFDFGGIAGGRYGEGDFDLAEFFGEKRPMRISTLATTKMILEALVNYFGEDPQFTLERAEEMHKVMIEDLSNNRKEDYTSQVGLAVLFDKSGGKITTVMRDLITEKEVNSVASKILIKQVRDIWDEWDLNDEVQGDERLQFDSFYNAFMIPYFGCYRCEDTRKAMQAIDMDCDGYVDWSEFLLYIQWALHEYPKLSDVDELLSVTFCKGIIPAMQDEVLKKQIY